MLNVSTTLCLVGLLAIYFGLFVGGMAQSYADLTKTVDLSLSPVLNEDNDANNLLIILIKTHQNSKDNSDSDILRKVHEYRNFIENHSSARACITAKFMAGLSLIESRDPNLVNYGQKCLEDISSNFPSVEGEISQKFILKYLGLRGNANKQEQIKDLQESVISLLPTLEAIDEKQDGLSRILKKQFTGSEEGVLYAEAQLLLGTIAIELGEKDSALKLFREIIQKYPSTKWSNSADRNIKTIEYLESKGMSINGRLK